MSRSRSVGRNVLLAAIGNAFAPLAALATAPIMAQGLGVSGRGDVAAATAPLLLATTAATFGIPAAVNYFVARNPRLVGALVARATALTIGAGAISTVVVVVMSGLLAAGDADLSHLIALASLAIVPSLLVSVLQSVAAGSSRWSLVTTERLITSAVRLMGFVALLAIGQVTVESSVLVLAVSPLFGAAAYLRLIRQPHAPQAGDSDVLATTGALVHYGARVWIGSITGILLSRLDQVLLLPLGGSVDLGLYVVAVTIGELPLVVMNAVRDVLFSADAAENSDERLGRASRLSTCVALGVAVVIGGTVWWWLPVIFGAEFRAAIPACLVILLAVVLGNPGSLAGVALSSRGRPEFRSLSLVAACVANIVVLVVLVPPLGALGAALATLVGNLVAANLCILLLRRTTGMPLRTFYGVQRRDVVLMADLFRARLTRS